MDYLKSRKETFCSSSWLYSKFCFETEKKNEKNRTLVFLHFWVKQGVSAIIIRSILTSHYENENNTTFYFFTLHNDSRANFVLKLKISGANKQTYVSTFWKKRKCLLSLLLVSCGVTQNKTKTIFRLLLCIAISEQTLFWNLKRLANKRLMSIRFWRSKICVLLPTRVFWKVTLKMKTKTILESLLFTVILGLT